MSSRYYLHVEDEGHVKVAEMMYLTRVKEVKIRPGVASYDGR